jgi:hypothetical protein
VLLAAVSRPRFSSRSLLCSGSLPLGPLGWDERKESRIEARSWETIRAVFHLFLVETVEMIYCVILAGPQKIRPVFVNDTS